MTYLNASSFTLTGYTPDGGEAGTVEVTLGRETRAVKAYRFNNCTMAGGLLGRYRTGKRAWPAVIYVYADGREIVRFGRDEHTSRCHKATLSFAPVK
jgi:hypothetical protein